MRLKKTDNMRKLTITLVCLIAAVNVFADINADSIKSELDKIVLLKDDARQTIEKYKKGVLKGDDKSMNLLGVECMSGTNIKADLTLGMNLLETAANNGYLDAQYNLGNYYFIFWVRKPENTAYFSAASKWLRKAVKTQDVRSYNLLGRLYFEYGKHNADPDFLTQARMLLATVPGVEEVSDKNEELITTQATLGNICLGQWRLDQDTTALRDAKKWYRLVLRSDKEYPTFSTYIDSLAYVLSQGVPMSIDPKDENAQANAAPQGGPMGGFGGMGGLGGFGGFGGPMGGGPGGPMTGPQGPSATYPGGMMQMMNFIRSNTFYPKDCEDARIKETVTVQFTIGTDGAVINPKIIKNVNYLLGQEALRTVMLMPDWIPAKTEDDTPVEYTTTTNVSFGSGGMGGGMGMMF